MENAKAKGKTIGRPPTTADNIPNVFYKHYPKYKNGEINKMEFSRLCNLSYPTIYKYLSIVENQMSGDYSEIYPSNERIKFFVYCN